MKRLIFLLTMVLIMLSSIVAGTLAMYTVSIDNLAKGSVIAKEFVFLGEGTDTFQQGLKISPNETVDWQFKVKNYKDQIVSETDMYYKLTFNVQALTGKKAIDPLTVTVKDLDGNILNSVTGVGTFDVLGEFPLAVNGQEKEYLVEINWPGDGNSDIKYAGSKYGTMINVDAAASQIPFASEPENPPQGNKVSVRYETTVPWQNGQSGPYQYEYKVTIINNSTEPINSWNIAFYLSTDRLTSAWSNAKLEPNLPSGYYKFINPGYNNPTTDNILPGQSVSFRGPAVGMGTEAIHTVTVGGSNISDTTNVDLTCEFGKKSLN
ncbi:putative cellulose binding protein [Desulfosporosinus orientis DSM 765]|uniref:Putative cellulose binding protein n=1 Tax=Desulfosporosinus orientis (strain ATCC 19365 / DSM 765 / NCIMB 8382 / VKM B-1628 / Singapore I) TaxID=768706 RepID=G7W639_DESOD|nr:cellulose binding domain-containing protein [Desulfosporosinus orientis]AET67701.1 putative cellulose binding protein [Desulfosporosinus orientis DSM 765]